MVKPKEVKTFWEATRRDMWVLTSGVPGFSFFFRDIPFTLNLWQGVGDMFGVLEKHYYAGMVGAYYRNEMEYYNHVESQNQVFNGMFDQFEPNEKARGLSSDDSSAMSPFTSAGVYQYY